MARFRRVLGTVSGAFWTILGGFWGFEKESKFEAEVGSRKSGSKVVKGRSPGGHREVTGSRPEGLAALITIVDQSIIDNIHRRSLTSFIIGH